MSNYQNGPGNIPRLPDRVVDTLIDSAGVSRCAPGRGIGVRDQSAEVERVVHDACEELLARLPSQAAPLPAAPAPTAEPVAWMVGDELYRSYDEIPATHRPPRWQPIALVAARLAPDAGIDARDGDKK